MFRSRVYRFVSLGVRLMVVIQAWPFNFTQAFQVRIPKPFQYQAGLQAAAIYSKI